jgi:hypothetical protein
MNSNSQTRHQLNSPSENANSDFKRKSPKKLMSIIATVIGFILIGISVYVWFSTAYFPITLLKSQSESCSSPVDPEVKYLDLQKTDKIGNNEDIPDDYDQDIRRWIGIHSISILYSLSLLVFFRMVGDDSNLSLIVIRKFIISIGTIGAILFIVIEADLIYLTVSIFQAGEIIKSSEEIILKLHFKINGAPRISFCPLDSSVYNYWTQELLIAAPVLAFITFTMIVVVVYLKVSSATSAAVSVENGYDVADYDETTSQRQKQTAQPSVRTAESRIHSNNNTIIDMEFLHDNDLIDPISNEKNDSKYGKTITGLEINCEVLCRIGQGGNACKCV